MGCRLIKRGMAYNKRIHTLITREALIYLFFYLTAQILGGIIARKQLLIRQDRGGYVTLGVAEYKAVTYALDFREMYLKLLREYLLSVFRYYHTLLCVR